MQETQAPSAIENETFFLRLDLPSTLIRHENAALQSGRIRKRRFFVFVWIENGAFRFPAEDYYVFKFLCVVWKENI